MTTRGDRRGRGGGAGVDGRERKGRVVQERDRFGFAIVGMNRVIRESSLKAVLFPGRDAVTFANRAAELARDLPVIGPYWTVRSRTLDDGTHERYLALTEAGYGQAVQVLGSDAFARRPVTPLKPSHVDHDLELADFAVSLLPRVRRQYQPIVRGAVAGASVEIEEPHLPTRWRWRHGSVYRWLTVLHGRKDDEGRFVERPSVVVSFEPDAVLETDTYNATRYFIEWDRGTEPLASEKERRTILQKLQRLRAYFWAAVSLESSAARHWAREHSHYVHAFAGPALRRPKSLFVTRSARRAGHMYALAARELGDLLPGDRLTDFFEVLTIEDARRKLQLVTARAEASPPAKEWPWQGELRR